MCPFRVIPIAGSGIVNDVITAYTSAPLTLQIIYTGSLKTTRLANNMNEVEFNGIHIGNGYGEKNFSTGYITTNDLPISFTLQRNTIQLIENSGGMLKILMSFSSSALSSITIEPYTLFLFMKLQTLE